MRLTIMLSSVLIIGLATSGLAHAEEPGQGPPSEEAAGTETTENGALTPEFCRAGEFTVAGLRDALVDFNDAAASGSTTTLVGEAKQMGRHASWARGDLRDVADSSPEEAREFVEEGLVFAKQMERVSRAALNAADARGNASKKELKLSSALNRLVTTSQDLQVAYEALFVAFPDACQKPRHPRR